MQFERVDTASSTYKLPQDPWVLRVRWRKAGMYAPGIKPPSSNHSSSIDLKQKTQSAASFSSSIASTADMAKSLPRFSPPRSDIGEPTDSVNMHLDIQLYEMDVGVYLVDFKCAGYETSDGHLLEEKDVTSPFPFLDLASRLIIQLAEAD